MFQVTPQTHDFVPMIALLPESSLFVRGGYWR